MRPKLKPETKFDRLFPGKRGRPARPRIQAAYAHAYSRRSGKNAWDPEDVRLRLEEAMVVIGSAPGRVGPATYGSAWPEFRKTFSDYVSEEQGGEEKPHDAPKQRRATTNEEWTRADKVVRWLATYLDHQQLIPQRKAVQLWMFCKARKRPFRRTCQDMSFDYSSMKRWCHDGYMAIALGLMLDGEELDAASVERKENPEFGTSHAEEGLAA